MRTPLKGGSSYKDKQYLIKWLHPSIPSLLPKTSQRIHRGRVHRSRAESSRGDVGHLLRQHKGASWPAQTPANGGGMSRRSELFSQVGSMRLSGSPCGRTRRRIWEPVLMFPSAVKKFIALIPKAFWELVLFALYHVTGGESGNIL